ncbi:HD domain-containing protein [Thermosyntropha sp.]|uniref:3'-5' exoribonuclease YhaM family protein n=1 Tax=Thermosyntropha sp. TaxID=2740820 RepID=UPI0025E144C6|nr:HD domain-containing protein [Thermosyntropha sp.]MBO8157961.1 HD domain-containing protein [Thermosyntropha sp.]
MDKRGPYVVKDIKKMAQGAQVWGKFLITEKNNRKTKDGREVVNLRIGDSTGEIDVVVWENCQVGGVLQTGKVIGILGDVGSYNNRIQITAKKVKVLDEDPSSYLKTPSVSIEELVNRFEQMLKMVDDSYLKDLLDIIFTDDIKRAFFKAPAARKIHHNYAGGLLEHTIRVAELCIKAASIYPSLNRDLLITGALLHDIGKIEEYEMNVLPEYTVPGRMVGHIVLGHEILDEALKKLVMTRPDMPKELPIMLKHMILSHHGSLEYGSPVKPLFPEALLLHMMDNLDAKLYVFMNRIEEEEDEEGLFTSYDTFFEQYFFKYRY